MPAPVALAPIGVLSIVHPDGESAVARAAASFGMPMVVSTAASTSLEDVAAAGGDAPRWYQLYWPKSRDLALSFLGRAAAAGYGALVLTLDTYTMGWRPRDLDNAFLPFLRAIGNQNYFADPVFQGLVGGPVDDDNRLAAVLQWAATFGNPALTWDDLALPARELERADRAQGDPARGRRAARGRRGHGRRRSSPTTAAGRWTARSRRSTRCPRSSRPSATGSSSSSTAVCAPARTSSRRSLLALARCCWAGRTPSASVSRARPASDTCCGACWPSSS